jgi:hypothetical protein
MPVTLSKLIENTADTSFMYEGEPVEIVYYPARISDPLYIRLQAFTQLNEGSDMAAMFQDLNKQIVYLVKSWDIYADEKNLFPLDADRLPELPLDLRIGVIQALMGDFRPEARKPQIQN